MPTSITIMPASLGPVRTHAPERQELIDSVRRCIANGVYDSPEKLDSALEHMLNDRA